MLKSELRQVPLQHLRDGADYPLGNINIRRGDLFKQLGDLGPLKASLRENGQLQNMVGTTIKGSDEVYLMIGNRRRNAAQANQDENPKLSLNSMDVRVYEDLTVEQAVEIGLAEKITELPIHKVDQYEAFAALSGKPPAEIAAHFDCSERLVKQRMRLGALSAKIRQAWRDGTIDEKTAQAFTLAPDTKSQDRAFAALQKSHGLSPRAVRARLLPDQQDVAHLLRFCSDEYQARGGGIVTDLFEDEHGATDPALLKAVADEVLANIAQNYIDADGFAWAAVKSTLPAEAAGWKTIKIDNPKVTKQQTAEFEQLNDIVNSATSTQDERRAARVEHRRLYDRLIVKSMSDKQKASCGVVVSIDSEGGVERIFGVVKPKEPAKRVLDDKTSSATPPAKNAPVKANAAADPEAPPRLSHKAQSQRAIELTEAVALALQDYPMLGLVVLLAGFADRGGYGPIRATIGGSGADALQLMEGSDMAQNIARLKAMKGPAIFKMVGRAAAASLLFQAHSAEHPAIEDKAVKAIVSLVHPKALQAALKRRFDPEDYFGKSLPKEIALQAIQENCGQGVFEDQRALTSANDLRAFALANIKPDWLPPELRFPGYAGPGAKKKSAGKAKSKPKKR